VSCGAIHKNEKRKLDTQVCSNRWLCDLRRLLMKNLMEKIETYGFECEAGALENCSEWIALKEAVTVLHDIAIEIVVEQMGLSGFPKRFENCNQ
jgi:hypothetical protein